MAKQIEQLHDVVVLFAGDSGDGMQLTARRGSPTSSGCSRARGFPRMRPAAGRWEAEVEMYYERVIHLLEDGEWHEVAELRKVTAYPTLWLEELRREGYEVAERPEGRLQVRARHDDRELAAVA